MPTHTIYHDKSCPRFGRVLAEILNDISVQTMLLHHGGEAVKPFKLHPCHIYMRCLSTFNVLDEHMDAHLQHHRHKRCPRSLKRSPRVWRVTDNGFSVYCAFRSKSWCDIVWRRKVRDWRYHILIYGGDLSSMVGVMILTFNFSTIIKMRMLLLRMKRCMGY